MKKVLVAGATGYLGRFVAQEFKKQGYWVRALARNPDKLKEEGRCFEPSLDNVVDEVFTGEVTKPETLRGLCDDIDIVFSSIGITRQKDHVTFNDVDYQGNRNLLDLAKSASVDQFIFVSVFQAALFKHTEIVKAREKFADELAKSGLAYAIIRPTGYFSDMTEMLKMAQAGRIYLFGAGQNRMNPIHGADLAKVCVDAVEKNEHEIPVGGPKVYTYEEIARMAFAILNKRSKITRIPIKIVSLLLKIIFLFNKHTYSLLTFMTTSMKMDLVAPATGNHELEHYFQQYAANKIRKADAGTLDE